MQDCLGIGERAVQAGQVGAGHGVDQHGARPMAAQLHQEGAMTVTEAGRALGVDCHRPLARGQRAGGERQRPARHDERRHAITRLQQRHCRDLGGLPGAGGLCIRPGFGVRPGFGIPPGRLRCLGLPSQASSPVGLWRQAGHSAGHDCRRLPGGRRPATPAASGGRPDAMHSASDHAAT